MMKTTIRIGIMVLTAVFVSGCVFIAGNSVEPDKFGPCKENKVGGGFTISYIAPEDGTVQLVDKKSGKNILTQAISAGQEYKFSAQGLDRQQYKTWGINIDKADFVLYFHPKYPKPPIPPQPPMPPQPPLPPQPAQP
jgi:hypothetical protein